jgi:catechol 2,3-dioxygenase-like lactoylglutathione lyase family enzyme
MGSRVLAVVLDCADVDRMTEFWREALGAAAIWRWTDARGKQYVEFGLGAEQGDSVLLLQPVADLKRSKNRMHLDLAPRDVDQATEAARLVDLGATVLADDADHPWMVLADPEGNEFCLLPPRNP